MGNQTQKAQNPLSLHYIQMEKQHHPLMAELLVVKRKSDLALFSLKQFRYASHFDHSIALKKMQRRKLLSQKKNAHHIVKLINIENSTQDDVCGMTFFLYCILEHIETSLEEKVLERKHLKRPFQQDQIIHFLKCICTGILFMHDNNLRNYYLTKESIIATENGDYKIFDTDLLTQLSPYSKILNSIPVSRGTYMSPELMEELLLKNNDPDISPKTHVFAAAVIVLDICTEEQIDEYYDYNKLVLNLNGLKQKVKQLNFSPFLKELMFEMLEVSEDDRIGLLSLKERLKQVSDNKSTTDYSQLQKSSTSGALTSKNHQGSNAYLPLTLESGMNRDQRSSFHMGTIEERKRINSFESFLKKPSLSPISQMDRQPSQRRKGENSINIISIGRQHSKSFNKPNVSINYEKVPQHRQEPSTLVNGLDSFHFQTKKQNYFNYPQYQTPSKGIGGEVAMGSTPIRKVQALQSNKQSPQNNPQQIKLTSDFVGMDQNYGKHHFSNGSVYEGQFDANKNFTGRGILYYPKGKICYSGNWKNNCFDGFGILYNERPGDPQLQTNYENFTLNESNSWMRYEGEFKMDKKEGYGTLYFTNGDKFSGCFCGDIVEGFGTFTKREGEILAGLWKNNILK